MNVYTSRETKNICVLASVQDTNIGWVFLVFGREKQAIKILRCEHHMKLVSCQKACYYEMRKLKNQKELF